MSEAVSSNTDSSKKYRASIGTFDLMKGLCMFGVMLFHSASYSRASAGMNIFHNIFGLAAMPIFFVVSGYGFRPMKAKKLVQKLWKELLIPYILCAAAIIVLTPVKRLAAGDVPEAALNHSLDFVLAFVFGLHHQGAGIRLLGHAVAWTSAAWFFLAMFWGSLLLNGILKIRNRQLQTVMAVLCVLLGILLEQELKWPNLCIDKSFCCAAFMYLGYTFKKRDWANRWGRREHLPIFITAGLLMIITIVNERPAAEPGVLCHLLDNLLAGLLSLLVISLSFRTQHIENPVVSRIRSIGHYSVLFLAVHAVEMVIFPWWNIMEKLKLLETVDLGIWLGTIGRLILCSCGVWIIRRIQRALDKRKKQKKSAREQEG